MVTYPQKPDHIKIRVSKFDISSGARSAAEVAIMTLEDKLHEYMVKLGCDHSGLHTTFTHLMTEGKVRVDFRYHIERIELLDSGDIIDRLSAWNLIEDYIHKTKPDMKDFGSTQRIVLQPPRTK